MNLMNFIKKIIYLNILVFALQANSEEIAPFYTESKVYNNFDKYCFPQGVWSGDISNLTIHYHLIVPREDQGKYGDIFLGFRKESQPDNLWLFGFNMSNTGNATRSSWVQYDKKQAPVVYSMGQYIPAITKVNIISKAVNLRQLEGDGEVLVGYGLRKNEHTTSPTDSFREMMSNNRLKVVWKFDSKQSTNFGNWTCIKFTEVLQQVNGIN